MNSSEKLIRRYFDAFNAHDEETMDEIIAPDHVHHGQVRPNSLPGPEGLKDIMRRFLKSFPDCRFTVEAVIDQGDVTAARWTAVGIHSGSLEDIPATGKVMTMLGLIIIRVVDGKIAESWVNWDFAGVKAQLRASV